MKKILFLHNGNVQFPTTRVDLLFSEKGFDVDYFWCADKQFPKDISKYCGVFISGSPHGAYEDLDWIHTEHDLIKELAIKQIPMLGVCFGSQILASALCSRDQVFRRETCEVGFAWIDLHRPAQEEVIFHGLKDKVLMFVWHNDQVKSDHRDMRILGTNSECSNHIWGYRNLPIWGIQGHPELTKANAVKMFTETPERFLKDGADINKLIRTADDTIEAKKLIHNFIDFCKKI